MFTLLISILKNKKNSIILGIGFVVLFTFFRITPQFHIIWNFFGLNTVSWSRKMQVLYDYSYGSFSLWNLFDTVVVTLLSLFTVINIIVFIHYYTRQKKLLNKGSIISTATGMFLGVFGVGCVSCGAMILAPVLSALGILGSLRLLPYAGRELAVVGLLCVVVSTYYLLFQIKKPFTCD